MNKHRDYGPEALPPDQYPGGVIIHVYGIRDGSLLIESRLRDVNEASPQGLARRHGRDP